VEKRNSTGSDVSLLVWPMEKMEVDSRAKNTADEMRLLGMGIWLAGDE
jgi:hypothetical protein